MDCDSIVTLDLFIVECTIIAATDFQTPVCTGEANGFLIFSVENGTPPFNYVWEHLTIAGIGGNGSTTLFDNNMIANVPAGIYEINISDNFGNQAVVFQEVVDPPLLELTLDAIDIDDFHISCFGGADGQILGLPEGGVPPYLYNWSTGATTDNIIDLAAGDYFLNVTDSNGCSIDATTALTEPSPIQIFANYTDPNCDGYDTGFITIDSMSGGTPPYRYSMDNDSFAQQLIFQDLLPGSYTVYVQDDNDCLVDTTASLNTPDIPEIYFLEDLEVNLGCDITIPTLTNNTTITKIQWTPNVAMSCDTCLRPTVAPVESQDYILTITSIDDCVDSDTISVTVIKIRDVYFPNAFSPNGDGVNDYFAVFPGKAVARINYLKVFDRWGAQVYGVENFPLSDVRAGWDGNHKGKLMNSGVFVWIAEVTYLDGLVLFYRGDISIVD
jgi:gliding motility-associated-like protein